MVALLFVFSGCVVRQPESASTRSEPARSPVPASSLGPGNPADLTAQPVEEDTYLDGYRYLRGVNMYTLQFMLGEEDASLVGEPQSSYDYLADRGHQIVRLAVPWRGLQPLLDGDVQASLNAPVDEDYLAAVEEEVSKIDRSGMRTILDLHNGCTYPWGPGDYIDGSVTCGAGISEKQATAIWRELSSRFKDDKRVAAYDIFNEPRYQVGVETYKEFAQAVVTAIRDNGDEHTIWVEAMIGVRGRLVAIAPEGPWIEDPLDRIVYSEHFYADESRGPFDADAGYEELFAGVETFADWCDDGGVHCSIGEVGWPSGGRDGIQTAESAEGWNRLFERFYDLADRRRLDVTYFTATSFKSSGPFIAYGSTEGGVPVPGIDKRYSQADTIEAHPSQPE
jgi:endoglucanase